MSMVVCLQTAYLTSMGGHNIGDTIRRCVQRLGTNALWSNYSLKGKKGKLAILDLPVARVLTSKCYSVLLS